MMQRLPPLKQGDTIGFINASSPTTAEKLSLAVLLYEKMGFFVEVGESCYSHDGFLSGSDELRADDINSMFKNPAIKAVFCIRGGYGSTRILDNLDYEMIKQNPKIFAGYSDITALHCAFHKLCGFVTFHCPMPTELGKGIDDFSLQSYLNLVIRQNFPIEIKNPDDKPLITIHEGCCKGELVGGNLSMLATLCGTKYDLDTKGKILFIEDVGEEPYRVDRMLVQLRNAGKFNDCEGVIIGSFTDCIDTENLWCKTVEDVLYNNLKDLNKPVIAGLCCGHSLPSISLPLGATVTYDTAHNENIHLLIEILR